MFITSCRREPLGTSDGSTQGEIDVDAIVRSVARHLVAGRLCSIGHR